MSLRLENVRKNYTAPDGSVVRVIDIAEFELATAQRMALVGASGSGKTTLLNIIAGILTPDSGRIVYQFADNPPVDLSELTEAGRDAFRGRHLGFIFQTHHLLPGFTALENVLLGMSFTGRSPDRPWAEHLLKAVGLDDRMNYRPAKLSVGQQQRVAVARALANRPNVVLADEPTGALDPSSAIQVLELILQLCDDVSASLLLVSHDPSITGRFARRIELTELNRASTRPAAATTTASPDRSGS